MICSEEKTRVQRLAMMIWFTKVCVKRGMIIRQLGLAMAVCSLFVGSCAFKFELTSQRTALENQIVGKYAASDEEPILIASSASFGGANVVSQQHQEKEEDSEVARARLSQEFNRDDVEQLKQEQIIGEGMDGLLKILPNGIGRTELAKQPLLRLAELIVREENRDREIIWKHEITTRMDLSISNLDDIKREYVRQMRKNSKFGYWLEDDNGQWYQKK